MSVAGTYQTTVKSPMGDQTGTFTVVDGGDGTFTGQLAGTLGSLAVEDGKVDGNTINGTVRLHRTVNEDTLTTELPWRATRMESSGYFSPTGAQPVQAMEPVRR